MAGSDTNFDAAAFRDAIHAVMQMGLTNVSADLPTFYFVTHAPTYPPNTPLDEQGRPYDLTIKPTSVDLDPVKVPCAVKYGTEGADYKVESVGDISGNVVTITLLDTDYALIKDADYVTLRGDRFNIVAHEPVGLFDVNVWTLRCNAVDEN